MLKNRIISKLLISPDGTAVKYRMFTEQMRVVGDPVSVMRTQEDLKVDEFLICFLGRVDTALVYKMTEAVFTPVTVAGSICNIETASALIETCGVEKVVVRHDATGAAVAARYGVQCAVWPYTYEGDAAFPEVPDWAGEVLVTSVDRDGMGNGCDVAAARFPWPVPVVLSGGVGKLSHVKDAFDAGASGCSVSSMFAFSSRTPTMLRSWLLTQGSNVRAA